MNLHELPMILFTVIAQMCVGMFIILGATQLWLSAKADSTTVDRLTLPILYVIGPALVFGLIASMFHMNDVMHVLNVIRHWQSSWLSREIIVGVGFAGAGFLFAVMQWFRIGSRALRQALGLITAVIGVALVFVMSMIYTSLRSVPAWHTWVVPFQFFATTIMLGAAAVAAAIGVMTVIRQRAARSKVSPVPVPPRAVKNTTDPKGRPRSLRDRLGFTRNITEINAPASPEEWTYSVRLVRACSVVSALAAVGVLISYTMHIQNLATNPSPAATASLAVYSGLFFWARLVLLALGAIVLGALVYRIAGKAMLEKPAPLAALVTLTFFLILVAEFMGRSLHYASMMRIGI
ncbi:dimethyl sulfoxide reductase anchor subunit family protein [Trueperella sp. LYQ143]|uniref:dimethyl sulfoxide reductase anchor subunit family protein n=1 Tax=Trueperella sp. LYQ143 TaxID=3391059 RepID=UPI003983782B